MSVAKDPLRSRSTRAVIDGRTYDVMCASFADRDFVVITQVKKLGTIVSITQNRPEGAPTPSFESNVVMGRDEIEYHVFSRAIAEVVFNMSKKSKIGKSPTNTGKPLLCTLALTELSRSLLSKLCEFVRECDVWS